MSPVRPLVYIFFLFSFFPGNSNCPFPSTFIWQAGTKSIQHCISFYQACATSIHNAETWVNHILGKVKGPWDKPSLMSNPFWLSLTIMPKHLCFLINKGLHSSANYSLPAWLSAQGNYDSIFMGHLLCGLKRHASYWGQSKDVWDIFSAHEEIINTKSR